MNILYLPSYDFWEYASTHKEDVTNIEVPGKPYYFIDNTSPVYVLLSFLICQAIYIVFFETSVLCIFDKVDKCGYLF